MNEKALTLQTELEKLVEEWHNSYGMNSFLIEKIIARKAEQYHALTGQFYLYSLARRNGKEYEIK